jgi:hypothetical protein
MFVPGFYYLSQNVASYQPVVYAIVWTVVAALFVASNFILFRVVKRREARRPYWVGLHLFVLLIQPLLLYLCSTVPREVFKVLALCCFFVPLALQVDIVERLLKLLRESEPASPAEWVGSAATAPELPLPGPRPPA